MAAQLDRKERELHSTSLSPHILNSPPGQTPPPTFEQSQIMAEGGDPGDPGLLDPGPLEDPQLNLRNNPEVLVLLSISGEGAVGYIPRVPLVPRVPSWICFQKVLNFSVCSYRLIY